MRIFLDANVVISAMLFPKGKASFVFEHVIEKHTAIISDYAISECKEVKIDKPLIFKPAQYAELIENKNT